jgi:hypothetical protein
MNGVTRALSRLLAAVVATAPIAFAPGAGAQIVRGTVVDSASARPIGGATVLLRTRDSTVASGLTDSLGAFVVRAPGPGVYDVVVRLFGYEPGAAPERQLDSGGVRTLRFELSRVVVALDTVRTVERGRTLFSVTSGQQWFAKHVREGTGTFVTRLEMLRTGWNACDVFARLPGLGYGGLERGIRCLVTGSWVAKTKGSCLITDVDRIGPISGIDSANIYVRKKPARSVRGRDSNDTISYRIPLTMIQGVELYLDRRSLPKDMSVPFEVLETMMRDPECSWLHVWTEIAW